MGQGLPRPCFFRIVKMYDNWSIVRGGASAPGVVHLYCSQRQGLGRPCHMGLPKTCSDALDLAQMDEAMPGSELDHSGDTLIASLGMSAEAVELWRAQ